MTATVIAVPHTIQAAPPATQVLWFRWVLWSRSARVFWERLDAAFLLTG